MESLWKKLWSTVAVMGMLTSSLEVPQGHQNSAEAEFPDPSTLGADQLCPAPGGPGLGLADPDRGGNDHHRPSFYCSQVLDEVSRAQSAVLGCQNRHSVPPTYCMDCRRERVDMLDAHQRFHTPLPLVCDEETGKKETCAKQYEGNDRVGSVELTEKGFVEEESTINVWHKARCNLCYENNDPRTETLGEMTKKFLEMESKAKACFEENKELNERVWAEGKWFRETREEVVLSLLGLTMGVGRDYPEILWGNISCFKCYGTYKPLRRFFDGELIGFNRGDRMLNLSNVCNDIEYKMKVLTDYWNWELNCRDEEEVFWFGYILLVFSLVFWLGVMSYDYVRARFLGYRVPHPYNIEVLPPAQAARMEAEAAFNRAEEERIRRRRRDRESGGDDNSEPENANSGGNGGAADADGNASGGANGGAGGTEDHQHKD